MSYIKCFMENILPKQIGRWIDWLYSFCSYFPFCQTRSSPFNQLPRFWSWINGRWAKRFFKKNGLGWVLLVVHGIIAVGLVLVKQLFPLCLPKLRITSWSGFYWVSQSFVGWHKTRWSQRATGPLRFRLWHLGDEAWELWDSLLKSNEAEESSYSIMIIAKMLKPSRKKAYLHVTWILSIHLGFILLSLEVTQGRS